MKRTKRLLLISCICFAIVIGTAVLAFAETYIGKAEKIVANDRGVEFDVVVWNSKDVEVYREKTFISAGVFSATELIDAIKNLVDKKTMEIYAHIEGGKEAIKVKATLEAYSKSVSAYVEPDLRPNLKDAR